MTPRILVFNGSNRSGSFSGKLADAAVAELLRQEAEVTRIQLADYLLPLMDEDLEREKGIPENAMKLARLFAAHDGVFIATPEYNSSLPPLLKNVIDWVSRVSRDGDKPLKPYPGKVARNCFIFFGTFCRSACHPPFARHSLAHRHAGDSGPNQRAGCSKCVRQAWPTGR